MPITFLINPYLVEPASVLGPLLLADDTSKLLLADGTSNLLLTNGTNGIDDIQNISALGTLATTDLMYGFKPGAPDEDFKADISTISNFVNDDGVLLATATATGGAEIKFEDGVNGVIFDNTYTRYRIYGYNVYCGGVTLQDLYSQVKRVGQGSYDATGYRYTMDGFEYPVIPAPQNYDRASTSSGFFRLMTEIGSSSSQPGSFFMDVYNPSSANNKVIAFQSVHETSNGSRDFRSFKGHGLRVTNDAIDGIRVYVSGANPLHGEFYLVGYND